MSEWQPIETAPEEAVEILVYDPKHDPSVRIRVSDASFWRYYRREIPNFGPSHWMPIPDVPGEQK